MTYRPDIDGLRAIAVMSVVIYHALPTAIPGGFVGVDVFFVISGYLITGILMADIDADRFSLVHFYERRIRRIVPALVAVVFATMLAGYFLLHPGDYRDLGESAIWTIGFLANIFFWLNTGYFDAARETMPLLHMWSLAVEEQFYLFWPILVFLFARWLKKHPRLPWFTLGALFLASFYASVHLSATNPQAAFYLPITRAWELGAGAIIALFSHRLTNSATIKTLAQPLALIGISLIIFALWLLSSDDPFPSYNAAYPVLGTALLILTGGCSKTLVNRVLSVQPMIFFGKISYSLYLWHWPLFVFFHHYTNGREISLVEAALLIGTSILLATLSWKFVELPLRYAKASRTRVFTSGVSASVIAAAIGLAILAGNGVPTRVPDAAKNLADHKTMWSWECPQKSTFDSISNRRCVLGESWQKANNHAVLWGDSHALHYAPLIHRIAQRQGYSVLLFDSCPPYLDNKHVLRNQANQPDYSNDCGREHAELMSFLANDTKVDLVVLASAWSVYPKRIHAPNGNRSEEIGLGLMYQGLLRLAEVFEATGKRTFVLTEVPQPGENLIPCVLSSVSGVYREPCDVDPTRLSIEKVAATHKSTNEVIHRLASKFDQLDVIDATARMCGEQWCKTFINDEFIYRDTNHLRRNLHAETMEQLIRTIGIESAFTSETIAGEPNTQTLSFVTNEEKQEI